MRFFRDTMDCFGILRISKNKRSLKAQLFSSFGLAAFVSLFLVVISSCFVVSNSGQKLIVRSEDLMIEQVENRLLSSSELFVVAGRAPFVEESVQILVEAVRDRIAGYPTMEGWETGKYVPFETAEGKQRMYPLNQPPVPLDWQITRDIEVDGEDNPFLDYRLKNYSSAISSTKTAHYRIPGLFYNEASAPPMNVTREWLKSDGLYQSTGDLSVFLKSMFEAIPEALSIEINFFNGGTGTTLQFPATVTDDRTFSDSYVSKGCEWMTTLKNPYTGKPYAETVPCHAEGTVVPTRLRNAMESAVVERTLRYTSENFENAMKSEVGTDGSNNINNQNTTTFSVPPTNAQKEKRETVLDDLILWEGPFPSGKDNKTNVITASKAVYDRITSELIGVVIIEILESGISDDLRRRVLDDDSDVYLLYRQAGVIISSTPDTKHKVFETLPQNQEIVENFKKSYYDRIPEFEIWRASVNDTIPEPEPLSATYFTRTADGGFLVSVPVPPIPKYPWENPNYDVVAFVVQEIPPSIFGEFDIFAHRVRQDVKENIIICISLGIIGLALILSILAVMSNVLTHPLTWITVVARKIINNDVEKSSRHSFNSFSRELSATYIDTMEKIRESKRRKKQGKKKRNTFSSTSTQYFSEGTNKSSIEEMNSISDSVGYSSKVDQDVEADDKSKDGFVNFDYHPEAKTSTWCTLSTELVQLLEAFQSMIHGFSGDGVSEVAEPGFYEIQNTLTWHSDYSKLYDVTENAEDATKKILSIRQVSTSTRATTIGSMEVEEALAGQASKSPTNTTEFSIPQDRPSFCSSPIDDQDSSGESSKSKQTNLRGGRFKKDRGIVLPGPPPKTSHMIVPAPMKVNLISNLNAPKFEPKPMIQNGERPFEKIKTACWSKLFWYIVLLMAVPVFLTNFIIGAIVTNSILVTLPKTWKENAKRGSNNIERDAMQLMADRKAAIIVNMMKSPVRDLHLIARTTNWLVFGGIERSSLATSLGTSSDDCKWFSEGKCPFSPSCSCDWDYEKNATTSKCDERNSSTVDPRYLQQQWFEVQKTDSDPVTGNRRSSPSFPISLHSPASTFWWTNISDMPGSEVGLTGASGYKTLYDRAIVSSASSVFNFPLFNYPIGARKAQTTFGGYLAFADDGLMMGWSGCNDWHSSVSSFVSTIENGASLIDNDLCADGKYGYDPRCQSWYENGRRTYIDHFIPAHVTPIYRDWRISERAQTITSPIANPRTGEYVGQVALDFNLNYEFIAKMLDGESSLTFMITPEEDILGGNTVVSPDGGKEWASAKIEDLIFTNEPNETNSKHFKNEVLPRMKAGERGNTRVSITDEDGLEEEICLYYTPVSLQLTMGRKPDDFTSGEKTTEHLVYSLGVGKPCDEIKRPYDGVEDAVNTDSLAQREIFIAIIVSSTVFFVVFSTFAAINIASPMIKLSNIVKNTKKGEYDSIPPLEGGCKEVQSVYNTFAKLNKIVKISNTSFFSGKLTLAHHFVSDALVLYRKINDRKAIGVTCNNLANTLFAMQFERLDDANCCDPTTGCYVKQALALYDEAMSYSHEDFDGAEGDLKVNYAIQLSDRLFNRGLYYLFIDGYGCAPEDSRQRGYNDITFSRNLHDDIRDYLLENKQLFSRASPYFSRLLRRINCLAAFYDDVGLREIWDARVLLDEAKELVDAATEASSKGSFCPLFQEVNCSGRQQQLESLEILLDLNCGEIQRAARTGMRMLVEDVYLMEAPFVRAAEALVHYMKETDADLAFSKRSIECTRNDLRTIVKSCRKKSLEIGKNTVFVLDINPSQWNTSTSGSDGSDLLDELNSRCLWLYDKFCQADDQIGAVANTVNDTQPVEIGIKEENEGRQRSFLDVATDISGPEHSIEEENQRESARASTCFPIGSQMLIDSQVSLQSDSYIVWITDGYLCYEERTMISLRDQIERLNQERCYQIHVLIVDLNRDSGNTNRDETGSQTEEEDWQSAQESLLREIGNVSKSSIYLSATSEDELRSVFDHLSGILSNNQSTSEFISFLTMEKF